MNSQPDEIPGTPSYLAPEMFGGNAGDEATDQFALGVTLWRLFAGRYPYGEIEAFTRPRFGRLEPPSHWRPEIPAWLDALLLRAWRSTLPSASATQSNCSARWRAVPQSRESAQAQSP